MNSLAFNKDVGKNTFCCLFNPFSNSLQNSTITMIAMVDSSEKQPSNLFSCAVTWHSSTQDDKVQEKPFLHVFWTYFWTNMVFAIHFNWRKTHLIWKVKQFPRHKSPFWPLISPCGEEWATVSHSTFCTHCWYPVSGYLTANYLSMLYWSLKTYRICNRATGKLRNIRSEQVLWRQKRVCKHYTLLEV